MSVESATYISQLNSALPANTDLITEGDNHLNLIKSTLLATFPNFTATAITPTSADVNKIAGAATTGAVGFNVATQSASDNTTLAASTAQVQSAILASSGITAVLPSQTGNSGKMLSTNGTAASWSDVGAFTTATFSAGATVTGAALLGYGTGSGGTVTQATSKSNSVTLNKPSGKITMHNAALGAGSTVLFTFSNSLIGSTDMVTLQLDATGISSTADYNVWASAGSGAAVVALKNISAGSLSESVAIRFHVTKVAQT